MKIGAACKWLDPATGLIVTDMNFRSTTVRYVVSLESEQLRQTFLLDILKHNFKSMRLTFKAIAKQPQPLRMWRLGSDVLPLATHFSTQQFYADSSVQNFMKTTLMSLGDYARKYSIRLSFHPAQFVVLGSPNLNARANSVREFEYHAQVAWLMGYRSWHQDGFCINVHVGGKNVDPKEFIASIKGLSEQAQNLITLENDEFSWGAQEIVKHFGDHLPLVLDVHHYWIMKQKYLKTSGIHLDKILKTWRGTRPKLHLAMSRQPLIPQHLQSGVLKLQTLLDGGSTKAGLRAHSDSAWHKPTLEYVKGFKDFDIMYEGKDKNIGQTAIAKHLNLV